MTARELEVARLIATGLTNRAIASELGISDRTVGAHIQNILNKLGAGNRAQIATWSALHATATIAPAHVPAVLMAPPVLRARDRSRNLATFRSTALAVGLLLAGTFLPFDTVQTDWPRSPQVSDHQILDGFVGSDIDTRVWMYGNNQPYAVDLAERGGYLTVTVSPAASNDFDVSVATVCKARGDFDAQVSFHLVQWPQTDGIWVSLFANGTPFNTYRASASWFDSYGVYLPPSGGVVRASGATGTLRLTRVGSHWTGYYFDNDRWVTIASALGPMDDLSLSPMVYNGSDATPFGGWPAVIRLNDFRVTADRIVC